MTYIHYKVTHIVSQDHYLGFNANTCPMIKVNTSNTFSLTVIIIYVKVPLDTVIDILSLLGHCDRYFTVECYCLMSWQYFRDE